MATMISRAAGASWVAAVAGAKLPFHASVTRPFRSAASNRFIYLMGLTNFHALTIYCRAVEMADEFKHSSAQGG
jgi:hypothetical protein